ATAKRYGPESQPDDGQDNKKAKLRQPPLINKIGWRAAFKRPAQGRPAPAPRYSSESSYGRRLSVRSSSPLIGRGPGHGDAGFLRGFSTGWRDEALGWRGRLFLAAASICPRASLRVGAVSPARPSPRWKRQRTESAWRRPFDRDASEHEFAGILVQP